MSGKPNCRGALPTMYLRTNYQTAMNLSPGQQAASSSALSVLERQSIAHCEKLQASGSAYAYAHGTRPNTMSHALSSSPPALLDWTGENPAVELVLELVSLYWFTDTFRAQRASAPRGLTHDSVLLSFRLGSACFSVRGCSLLDARSPTAAVRSNQYHNTADSGWRHDIAIKSPHGYSWLPKEIIQQPLQWIGQDNESVPMVHGTAHDKGRHFPAIERPVVCAKDICDMAQGGWRGCDATSARRIAPVSPGGGTTSAVKSRRSRSPPLAMTDSVTPPPPTAALGICVVAL